MPLFSHMQKAGFLMTRLMLSRPNLSVLVCFVPTRIEKIVKQTRMALIKLKHDLMEYRIRYFAHSALSFFQNCLPNAQ